MNREAFLAALAQELDRDRIEPHDLILDGVDSLGLVALLVWVEDLAGKVDPELEAPTGPAADDLYALYRRLSTSPP